MKKLLSLSALLISLTAFSQHSLVLKNGDKLSCLVLSLNEDVWEIFKDGKSQSIPMKEVASVFFDEYVPYDGKLTDSSPQTEITVNGFKVLYQIKDRKLDRNPKVSIGSEDKGTVVVKITVDRYGNIRSAEPGVTGSTTSNKYLLTKAKIAASSAKFDENLKGPLITEGTITIIY